MDLCYHMSITSRDNDQGECLCVCVPPVDFVRGLAVWQPEQQEMNYLNVSYIYRIIGNIVKGL